VSFVLPLLRILHIISGLVIKCKGDEFNVFNPPPNQNCSQWADDFVNVFGGYLDNPGDTAACRYCQYAVGDQYLEPLNMQLSTRWRDVCLLLAFIAFNIIATIGE
jgi:ATP-binding cassette, subfamily G (WHITE), member 2, SNQ2